MKKTTLLRIGVLFSFFAVLILAASCGGSKKATTIDNEVKLYCAGEKYMTTTEYMRANSTGVSADMEIARDKALTQARARLSTQIEVFVSGLTDFYKKDTRIDENEKLETRFENLIREVFKNKLNGVYPICEKVIKENGKYRAYVAVELGGKELLNNVASKISGDEELKVDYDYDKFKKSYEDAMEELKKDRDNY